MAPGIAALLDLVVAWSRRIDLTAARSPEELVDLYLADAFVIAVVEPASDRRWIDVGSGGGAPGLALALLRPDVEHTLVEPRVKRAAFLRTAMGAIGLTRVRVVQQRSELLSSGAWEVSLSRATLPPQRWLAEGTRLATHAVWVLLARGEPPSQQGWRLVADIDYHLPHTRASRRALRYVPSG